ncbi:hypothetical protein HKCCE2091_15415 [Rhodobacterales bacterium HKCCE2091]|nr:hypothetical protein [Rhodobacterales bacterium HKCCE2091]
MFTTPPIFIAPALPVERPQKVVELQPVDRTEGTGVGNDGGGRFGGSEAAVEAQVRRLIRSHHEIEWPGFLPLDTREVGDSDEIDPMRPTARMPEPIVTLDQMRDGTADPVPAIDPPPEPEGEAGLSGDAQDATETGLTLQGQAPVPGAPEDPGDTAMTGPGAPSQATGGPGRDAGGPRAPDQPTPWGPTGKAAEPPARTATAPDVPDPPPPGRYDLRR